MPGGLPSCQRDTSLTVAVAFENTSRHFGAVVAVDRVDLVIEEGSFFAMLGPSGSGKTTCLRLISGFERPSAGLIRIFGEDSNDIPPNRRPVNTVFQDYALFPHLDVDDNVAYGLMVRGVPRDQRKDEAGRMLELVKLSGYGRRKPSELSGGQRQRVALARALINRPRVLLLDEPLGALDLKLREQMQDELKAIQETLGITFIFVTHDQGEALSMADQIAVMNEGRVIQTGSPQEIYEHPRTRFVADFVGSSNVFPPEAGASFGEAGVWSSLRPEAVSLGAPGEGRVDGHVVSVRYLGASKRVTVAVRDHLVAAVIAADSPVPDQGGGVSLIWPAGALHVMDDD